MHFTLHLELEYCRNNLSDDIIVIANEGHGWQSFEPNNIGVRSDIQLNGGDSVASPGLYFMDMERFVESRIVITKWNVTKIEGTWIDL
jgi:hypothetical protein